MRREIFRNLSWLTASNVAVKPIWFVFITYVCIRTIGGEQYGEMAAVLALMGIVDGTMMLGTSLYSTREVARQRDISDVFFSNFLLVRGGLAVVGIFLGLAIEWLLGNSMLLTMAMMAGFYIVARSFTEYCRTFFRAHEVFRREAYSTALEKVLVVACGSAALAFVPSAVSVLAGMTIGMIITSVINYRWVVSEFAQFRRSLLNREFIQNALPLAIPLGLSSLFVLLFMRTDSVMIEAMVGELETAQYALAYRILEALIIIPSMLVAVLLPRLSVLNASNRRMFTSVSRKGLVAMLVIGGLVAALVYLLAPLLINLIDDSAQMRPSYPLLQVLIWSFPLAAANFMLSTSLTAANRQKIMSIVLGLAAVVNIGLNFWMIPEYGARGAAISTIATEVFVSTAFLWILTTISSDAGPRPTSVTVPTCP